MISPGQWLCFAIALNIHIKLKMLLDKLGAGSRLANGLCKGLFM